MIDSILYEVKIFHKSYINVHYFDDCRVYYMIEHILFHEMMFMFINLDLSHMIFSVNERRVMKTMSVHNWYVGLNENLSTLDSEDLNLLLKC